VITSARRTIIFHEIIFIFVGLLISILTTKRCKSWKSEEGEFFCGRGGKCAFHILKFNYWKRAKQLYFLKVHNFTLLQQQACWL
jgi:hypothetical protein